MLVVIIWGVPSHSVLNIPLGFAILNDKLAGCGLEGVTECARSRRKFPESGLVGEGRPFLRANLLVLLEPDAVRQTQIGVEGGVVAPLESGGIGLTEANNDATIFQNITKGNFF